MANSSELRDKADQARRLAQGTTDKQVQVNLLDFANELDSRANGLSRAETPDLWTEVLRCPKCFNRGATNISQEGTNVPSVVYVSEGFQEIKTEYGPTFHCTRCAVPARP